MPSTSVETSNVTSTPATQSPALLTDAQLAQIRSIVPESAKRSAAEIAMNAAWTAVQAMTLSPAQSHPAVLADIPSASSDVLCSQPSTVPDVSTVDLTQFFLKQNQPPHMDTACMISQLPMWNRFSLASFLTYQNFHPVACPLPLMMEPVFFMLQNSVFKVKKVIPSNSKNH